MGVPVVILASGVGSGFESIANAVDEGRLSAEIRAVISDRQEAPVLEKARDRGIPAVCIPFERKDGLTLEESRKAHADRILSELSKHSPRFVVMAGYMRIVSPVLLEAFRDERGYTRVVNIHPSLLPAFPGVGAYAQAYRYGAQVAGATVHLVEADVDSGPICAQEAFSIKGCRSEAEVEKLGKEIEHRLYPETLAWVLPEKFSVETRPAPESSPESTGIKEIRKSSEREDRRLCVRPN